MFCLWFSLIYVLHSSVSADEGVSLSCNQTVNVTVGENVTLKCFINWTLVEGECSVLGYDWRNSNGTKLCDRSSTKYVCDSAPSDVSLSVMNVLEEESFTVALFSNCGMEKSQPIRVQLLHGGGNQSPDYRAQEEESVPVTTVLLCVSAAVAALLLLLFFLLRTCRRRGRGACAAAGGGDSV